MKVQPPSANGMFKSMVKKGLISKEPGVARSIEILIDADEIPRWKKKINSTMKLWAPVDASREWLDQRGDDIIRRRKAARRKAKNQIATRNHSSPETIYRFKITLRNTKPPIWRRIETHDASIEQLVRVSFDGGTIFFNFLNGDDSEHRPVDSVRDGL